LLRVVAPIPWVRGIAGQFKDLKANSVSDSFNRGKDAIAATANDAAHSAGSDLQAIRNDLNNLKDTLSRFMSQASNEAVKTARLRTWPAK
jgi:hypothetical protein